MPEIAELNTTFWRIKERYARAEAKLLKADHEWVDATKDLKAKADIAADSTTACRRPMQPPGRLTPRLERLKSRPRPTPEKRPRRWGNEMTFPTTAWSMIEDVNGEQRGRTAGGDEPLHRWQRK